MDTVSRLKVINEEIQKCRDRLANMKGYKSKEPNSAQLKLKETVTLAAKLNYLLGYKRCLTDIRGYTQIDWGDDYDEKITNEELGIQAEEKSAVSEDKKQ